MNLFSMINIYDEPKEHKAQKGVEYFRNNRDSGYAVYESLEHNNRYQKEVSFAYKMEILRNSMR